MSAFLYLFITLAKLAAGLFFLRFLLQLLRADFHNPLSHLIERFTAPVAGTIRKVLKPVYLAGRGWDVASLIGMLLTLTILVVSLVLLQGAQINVPVLALAVVVNAVYLILGLYQLLIFAEVIMSWLGQQGQSNPAAPLLWTLNQPLIGPVRNLLPSAGGLDFSPMVVLFALFFLRLLVTDLFGGLLV